MRATNSVEYKSWVSAIETALLTLSAFNGPAMALPIASSKSAGRTAAGQAHRRVSQKTPNLNSELTTPSPSLHLIKLLAEGYDSITRQWMLAATETRQFSTEIASIQPSRINPELCVAS
ncbi:unnamed protein product [Phytophthora lilii]|uniref:Unnamed protein product n=1 Tax=Phytophthora lilii TaxID=2077276 RepID=A0A9W6WWH6_9STRA|nr:unnamed protein product [Phytophthora lilii]